MITFAVWNLIHLAMLVVVGFGLYKLVKKFDDRVEKRRLAAFDVSTMLSLRGCIRLPRILRAYAVGDYSGAAQEIRKFVEAVEGGVDVMAKEFEKVFDSVLSSTLATETGRILVKAKLDAASALVVPAPPALAV